MFASQASKLVRSVGGGLSWRLSARAPQPQRIAAATALSIRQKTTEGAEFKVSQDWIDVYPKEWAIWQKLDRDGNGVVSNSELRTMCRKFDSSRHADFLVKCMDPDHVGFTTFPRFCKSFDAVSMIRSSARHRNWNRTYGLGVAGNVAGHMAQAGEADAAAEDAPAAKTPAAIFTFYAPHPHTVDASETEVLMRLSQFPVTNAVIRYPQIEGAGNVQVEPEMGLYVDIVYSKDEKRVERLVPRRIAAFNDCSIRKLDGSQKLSEKKNWGEASKGISLRSFRIHSMAPGTLVDELVLVSYIKRGDQVHQYSVDAPAKNYLMFHEPLLDWIIDRINNQATEDKWEAIFPEMVESDYPTSMWIALGAGEYTEWGSTNFLQAKDECLVLVYNTKTYPEGPSAEQIAELFSEHDAPKDVIALHQTFI